MRIAILGGYGSAGARIAELLADRGLRELILVGRDADRARQAAGALAETATCPVTGVSADASDPDELRSVLQGVDLLLVASSTIDHTPAIAQACADGGADYLDINLSSPEKWRALERAARLAPGRCFITDGGLHPGLPGVMIRPAGLGSPGLSVAWTAGAFGIDWAGLRLSPETVAEFARELQTMDTSVLVEGTWKKGVRRARRFDFGPPFGLRSCVPMGLREVRDAAAEIPGLRNAGFFVAGFGPAVDYVIMPVSFGALWIAPRASARVGRFFHWGLRRFSRPGLGATLVLEGRTAAHDVRMNLSHDDAYHFTAVAVVACLLQYLDGRRKPGLWTQAGFVDPTRFLRDLDELGVHVQVQTDAADWFSLPTT
jgi:saccharopine dehydrogenase (NAD+, L-lysine-forming)